EVMTFIATPLPLPLVIGGIALPSIWKTSLLATVLHAPLPHTSMRALPGSAAGWPTFPAKGIGSAYAGWVIAGLTIGLAILSALLDQAAKLIVSRGTNKSAALVTSVGPKPSCPSGSAITPITAPSPLLLPR